MTRQNRVTPYGAVIVSSARGTLTGNRGCLHDDEGIIRRSYVGARWILCLLSFKGRRRQLMMPGRYTELFFLDEATGLAAGHRPCAECQRARFEEFRAAWAVGNPEIAGAGRPSALTLDAALQADRLTPEGHKSVYEAPLAGLPDGSFVAIDLNGEPYLVLGDRLLRWTPFGYDRTLPRSEVATVYVLTPRSVVHALAAGYAAGIHPSAASI